MYCLLLLSDNSMHNLSYALSLNIYDFFSQRIKKQNALISQNNVEQKKTSEKCGNFWHSLRVACTQQSDAAHCETSHRMTITMDSFLRSFPLIHDLVSQKPPLGPLFSGLLSRFFPIWSRSASSFYHSTLIQSGKPLFRL